MRIIYNYKDDIQNILNIARDEGIEVRLSDNYYSGKDPEQTPNIS